MKRFTVLLCFVMMVGVSFGTISEVFEFDFENDSGATIVDKSGSGNNGGLYNTTYTNLVTSGAHGGSQCVELLYGTTTTNGGFLGVALDTSTFSNEFAVTLWTKRYTTVYGTTTGASSVSALVGTFGGSTSYNAVYVENVSGNENEPLNAIQVYEDGSYSEKSNLTIDDDGDWHFVAIRQSATYGLYIRVDDQVFTDVSETASVAGTDRIYFGKRAADGGSGRYAGLLDDITVYNGAMTDAEMNALYVPEPATMALLGFGGLVMAVSRKRS